MPIAAMHMIEPRADRPRPITLGADKAYDAEDFVNELRSMNATPHVAQNTNGRSSAIDDSTTRQLNYAVQPTHPQADRGGLWLDQDRRRPGTDQVPRPRARRMGLRPRGRRLQSGAAAKAPGGFDVKAPANCHLIGRWRIAESDLWDRAHLDLCGSATLTIAAQGGQIGRIRPRGR
jgi:hypothetical protein